MGAAPRRRLRRRRAPRRPRARSATPSLVPATIARSIGIVDIGTGTDAQRLYGLLRDLDLLLVLDNFEQVAPAAGFVAELLAVAPRVSVLVTSRQPLHLRGEHEIAVPPLGPDDAVALFLARARAVRPGFGLDATTEPLVESICAELDRLPLAIELAAARSKVLSPAELHARLGRRLDLLTRGPRDQPDRLRSMHATISWSYDALPPDVQTVFSQLSVFSGGWNLAGRGGDLPDGGSPRSSKRWRCCSITTSFDATTQRRVAVLDVRDRARVRVATNRRTTTTRCVDGTPRTGWRSPAPSRSSSPASHQAAWLDRMEIEHDNIRSALRWALIAAPEIALDLAGTMWRFWLLRGYATEGLDWIERASVRRPRHPRRSGRGR